MPAPLPTSLPNRMGYIGRLAPTPTGDMHLGHVRTFRAAWQRAREASGELILRIEDLDHLRCRPEYTTGMIADLQWLGLTWTSGPYFQSKRRDIFVDVWHRLRGADLIYPSDVSRREIRDAAHAPHEDDENAEPVFPPALRASPDAARAFSAPAGVVWRFRVPDGEAVHFEDARCGSQCFVAGEDFGDFVIWRKDDVPAYELAVVADDVAMGVTEVVRGEDLLKSTARQLLLYRALGATPPAWCHEPLIRDSAGRRLAKRDASTSLTLLRAQGWSRDDVFAALDRISPG